MALETENDIRNEIQKYRWYHTIDLGNGIITPGEYDHRSVLKYYGIPEDLSGKTVLDVGPAHGFFSFEFERRNARRVVAVELPRWSDHDSSPELKKAFQETQVDDQCGDYLHGALDFAIKVKKSQVERLFTSIYHLSPETVGIYDLVFCGSLLVHLSDPIRALYALRSVTREYAIISTPINIFSLNLKAKACFYGTLMGQSFWEPNLKCLKHWALASGFSRVEKVATFKLTNKIQKAKSFHGTIKAFV
jgi:tRNA (mo5U34)-methyltransferase